MMLMLSNLDDSRNIWMREDPPTPRLHGTRKRPCHTESALLQQLQKHRENLHK